MKQDDGLPQSVCIECSNHIIESYRFRRKAFKSEEILKQKLYDTYALSIKSELLDEHELIYTESSEIEMPTVKTAEKLQSIDRHKTINSEPKLCDKCSTSINTTLEDESERIPKIEIYTENVISDPLNSIESEVNTKEKLEFKENINNDQTDVLCSNNSNTEIKSIARYKVTKSKGQIKIKSSNLSSDDNLEKIKNQPINEQNKLTNTNPIENTNITDKAATSSAAIIKTKIKLPRAIELENSFACPLCGKETSKKRYVMDHLRAVHFNPNKKRNRITRQITSEIKNEPVHQTVENKPKKLKLPEPIELENGGFACPICGKKTTKKRYVSDHLRTVHFKKPSTNNKPTKPTVKKAQKMLPFSKLCEICGTQYSNRTTYKNHYRKHFPDQCLSCRFCDKKFGIPSLLKIHEMIHTGEKPYMCDSCDFRCNSRCSLKVNLIWFIFFKQFIIYSNFSHI